MYKHNSNEEERQEKTRELEKKLVRELWPLLVGVKRKLDRRLVNTLLGLVMAILLHRHRNHGLLLSELGGYLLEPGYCQAGTKRISNLLHSQKWEAAMIEEYLWGRATQRVEELWGQGEWPLVIWDESVQEKSESLQAEGLCAVRSSKAGRLKRIKPGYYNPPGGPPVFVPGFHWLQARLEEAEIFDHIDQLWGKEVIHVWDRGFAGNPWLTQAFLRGARFILRWPKNYNLLDEQEQRCKPGEISKGKRSWDHRLLWDARHQCECKTGVIAFPVLDPTHQQSLWLVVARRKNQSPWYLLTSEPAHTPALAWQIVLAYARRWQVEMAIRYHKSELAFESPRLIKWNTRHKLLLIAALAYSYLLSFLPILPDSLAHWLLQHFCPRTGKRSRDTPAPLYRLRFALSLFWFSHPPPFLSAL
jgi:hypothetical protein